MNVSSKIMLSLKKILLFSFVLLLVFNLISPLNTRAITTFEQDMIAVDLPNFSLKDVLTGENITNEQFQGVVLVVSFLSYHEGDFNQTLDASLAINQNLTNNQALLLVIPTNESMHELTIKNILAEKHVPLTADCLLFDDVVLPPC